MIDLPDAMFTTPEMASIFSGEARLQRMLDFEAALAHAQARSEILPEQAAVDIADKCRVKLFDVETLYREAAVAGTPVIPLVRMLAELVEDRSRGYVHWGATSQDAVDTGMVLQARDGLDHLIQRLRVVGDGCASLAERHRDAPMPGRTLLQHALPVSFGLKAAHWLSLIARQIRALERVRVETGFVQLGGGAGTLASLGSEGIRVTEFLAEKLGLAVPEIPWHTDRDRVVELVTVLAIATGAMAKIAADVALMMQTEVAEVAQSAAGIRAGSSTMPQKRNPVDAAVVAASARVMVGVVSAALASMVQEHERGVGGWQAEWAVVPDAFRLASSAVDRVRSIVETLEPDLGRMRSNLDVARGQIMSEALMMRLAPQVGKQKAYRLVASAVQRAVDQDINLQAAAAGDDEIRAVLDRESIEETFDPLRYLGSSHEFIRRAVDGFRESSSGRPSEGLPVRSDG
jgi:3-carboxy-cis,cis-muconate cycloisomerase